MNKIIVSEKLYEEIPIYEGYESFIYKVDNMLYKIFKSKDKDVLGNKQAKLEILNSLDISHVKPIDLIEINGQIQDFSCYEKKNYKPLDIFKTSKTKKLELLNLIRNELDLLHQYNIIFGDLNHSNVLINWDNVCFCDLDNCQVENYSFDTLHIEQRRYLKLSNKLNYLDNYMFNLLAIYYLSRVEESYCLTYLREHSLPHIINSKENKEIIYDMICLNSDSEIKIFDLKRYHLF